MTNIVKELEIDMNSAALAEESRQIIPILEQLIAVIPVSNQSVILAMAFVIGKEIAQTKGIPNDQERLEYSK